VYHRRRLDGSDIPVEFINNEWYALPWRITDAQHPDYVKPPQILPVEARELLPLYPGNSDKSCSSASAINSPPEYQGRDPVADEFAMAVAQLTTSREPIAPIHINIEETMQ
jgi:hypothetical protein